MADDKKIEKEEKKAEKEAEAPLFEVTQKFFSGDMVHEPGSKIYWAVPEGWDEVKQGRHYASLAPSVTFRPLNAEAKALLEKHAKLRAAKK